jgi:hypothetical protein
MEVCRRVGNKRRFYEDPNWAKPILMRMAERSILETDIQGRYRIKPVNRKKKAKWIAPDISKILEDAGVAGEGGEEGEIATDEYYEQL